MSASPQVQRRRFAALIGGFVIVLSAVVGSAATLGAIQTVRAREGAGVMGTLTVTEVFGCTPSTTSPESACTVAGRFVSDDGAVADDHVSTSESVPPSVSTVGSTIRVRYYRLFPKTGFLAEVYPADKPVDVQSSLVVAAVSACTFFGGLIIVLPLLLWSRLSARWPTVFVPRPPKSR